MISFSVENASDGEFDFCCAIMMKAGRGRSKKLLPWLPAVLVTAGIPPTTRSSSAAAGKTVPTQAELEVTYIEG